MRKILSIVLLALVALTSCSAMLNLRCTAPVNDGTCATRVLLPTPVHPMYVHFAWSGLSSGEDSVATTSGSVVNFSRQVPAGIYTVRAWASDLGGASCDTIITVVVKAPPDKVTP